MATFQSGVQNVNANSYRPMYAVSAEHENTLTAANFADSSGDALTPRIAADTLRVGDLYEYHAFVRVMDNNSTDTLTLLFRAFDQTTQRTIYAPAAFDAADDDLVYLHGFITVHAVGTSGVLYFNGSTNEIKAGTATSLPIVASLSLDTTANIDFNVNADWSVAHADNEARLDQFIIRKCNV